MTKPLLLAHLLVFLTIGCLGGSTATPELTSTPAATATAVPTATAAPAPTATTPPSTIELQNSVSTVYYEVLGSTAMEIFDSIEANGPRDDDGEDALGLAAWEWTVPTVTPVMTSDGCQIQSFTMNVELVVTLPGHANPATMAPDVAARWTALAAEVAAHEQRHVDIVVEGMRSLEQKLRDLGTRPACSQLRADVNGLWSDQNDLIEADQAAFHVADEARIAALQAPIKAQVEANEAQLLAIEAQLDLLESQLAGTNAEVAQIEATYPDLVLPPDVYDRYERLIQTYNATVADHNALVDQHAAIVFATNRLIEDLNWLQ